MFNRCILQNNMLIWCNIGAINASIMKYKSHMRFNYQNWLIESVFISHITDKSAENGTCCSLSRRCLACKICLLWRIAPMCCSRAIYTYILSAPDMSKRDRWCCLLPQCAGGLTCFSKILLDYVQLLNVGLLNVSYKPSVYDNAKLWLNVHYSFWIFLIFILNIIC